MDTRREFFDKIRTAVMGAAAIAAVIPAKPASKEIMWWLGKDFKWTGFVPAKDQSMVASNVVRPVTYPELEKAYNDAMKGGAEPDYVYVADGGRYRWVQVPRKAQNG